MIAISARFVWFMLMVETCACFLQRLPPSSSSSSSSTLFTTTIKKLLQEAEVTSPFLDPFQEEAVRSESRYTQVLAGPGSGKTRVVAYRIAELIQSRKAPPSSILAVTFTKKAADEMRQRVQSIVGKDCGQEITIATMHSLCCSLLRQYTEQPNFTIYDDADSLKIVKSLLKVYKEKDCNGSGGGGGGGGGDDDDTLLFNSPSTVQKIISFLKREGAVNMNVNIIMSHENELTRQRFQIALAIIREYQRSLNRNNAKDFDDLILDTTSMVQAACRRGADNKGGSDIEDAGDTDTLGDGGLYARLNSYRHILIDEFQDVDNSQFKLIQALSSPIESSTVRQEEKGGYLDDRSLFVVGDGNQAIYSWRGANSKNMQKFKNIYPGCSTVSLCMNYRSSKNIQTAASSVIERLRTKTTALLSSDKQRDYELSIGEKNESVGCDKFNSAAADKVRVVETYDDTGQKCEPHEIAVLYRRRSQSLEIEGGLRLNKIPYTVVGGIELTERKEVKDLLAYLRFICNPDDMESMRRVINFPTRGVGDVSQQVFFQAAQETLRLQDTLLQKYSEKEEEGGGRGKEYISYVYDGVEIKLEEGKKEEAPPTKKMYLKELTYFDLLNKFSMDEQITEKKTKTKKTDEKEKNQVYDIVTTSASTVPPSAESSSHLDAMYQHFVEILTSQLGSARLKTLQSACVMFCHLRTECESWEGPLDEFIKTVMDETGLSHEWLRLDEADKRKEGRTPKSVDRIQTINSVLSVSELAEADIEADELLQVRATDRLLDFLDIFLLDETIGRSNSGEGRLDEGDDEVGKVRLMTVHASKGLEFDYVVITGLEEGSFPMEGAITHVADSNTAAASIDSTGKLMIADSEELQSEEERRLLYVGITRARKQIYLTYRAKTILGRKHIPNTPSNFLSDIPKDILTFRRYYQR